jgi:FAD synthase
MKMTLQGHLAKPAITVVGEWDPFLLSHRALLASLCERAAQRACSSLGIVIDPSPGTVSPFRFRYGRYGWPVYDSVSARIGFMRACGLDAVLCVRFRQQDFAAGAAEFLDAVRAQVTLDELWLGALQQLGSGPSGSPAAIAAYATEHAIRLTMLPLPPLGTYDTRSFLATGRLVEAIDVVGRPPIWERPRSGTLRLAWRPGRYRAIALQTLSSRWDGDEITLDLNPDTGGTPQLTWPRRDVRYLAFVSGPADRAPSS